MGISFQYVLQPKEGKILINSHVTQGHKEWLTEVNVLGIVDHQNLVKLVGYCAEEDERGIQRLLVYEFMPNGSVEDHLSARSGQTLSWPMRLKVALDAARGLTYLHEEMSFQVFLASSLLFALILTNISAVHIFHIN